MNSGPKVHNKIRNWAFATVAIIILIVSVLLFFGGNDPNAIHYKTEAAAIGDLSVTVTATGTLEPVNQVDVGSEISGTIKTVTVDFNDRVVKGQVLATIDTEQLQARVNQVKASLELAKAKVEEADATVEETKQKHIRQQALAAKGLCSQEDCDAARAAYYRAIAGLNSAKAQVVQAKAALDAEKTTLRKATIYSPVNGIVLNRNVEPGQTVAASLQTPVLFTLAEDLTKMELRVDVDEADVGQVKQGQEAIFAVDSYPTKSFPANITEVHLAPKTVEGVVTYQAVLKVNNSEMMLRPGMTATASITVKKVEHALLIPNAALRFSPPSTEARSEQQGGSLFSKLLPRRRHEQKRPKVTGTNKVKQNIWTLNEGQLRVIPITTGASDGRFTEVLTGDLKPGMPVVVDAVTGAG